MGMSIQLAQRRDHRQPRDPPGRQQRRCQADQYARAAVSVDRLGDQLTQPLQHWPQLAGVGRAVGGDRLQQRAFAQVVADQVHIAATLDPGKAAYKPGERPMLRLKLTDKDGRVLPDAHVMNGGSTALDLARKIHSELAQGFLYAVDARTGMRLSGDYVLKNGDIIKVVSSGKRG